jgi:hypothetical protein
MAEGTVQVTPRTEPEPTYETDWVEAVPQRGENQRVVLWEAHPQHPSGEAFLVPGPARHVALTPEVSRAIRDGLVKRVPEPALTLEEHMHYTGTHGDAVGEYHHIAMVKPEPKPRLKPRLRPTAEDRKPAEPHALPPPEYKADLAEAKAEKGR